MNLLAVALPLLGIAFVYATTWDHGFVWDDGLLSYAHVYRVCDFAAIFTTPANTFEYLPVRDLTLCVDHALWGSWAGGFHLQNVLVFALACTLLTFFYRRIFAASRDIRVAEQAPLFALLCVLVFALHPLQVEPVAFITARNALLALLFLIAALVATERFVTTRLSTWYALSILFSVLALFSKATALPTAGLVFLTHLFLMRESSWTKSLRFVTPHLLITIGAVLLHGMIAVQHGAMEDAPSITEVIRRLPRAGFVLQFYLYKFIWPYPLTTDYVLDGVGEHWIALAIGAALLAGVIGLIVIRGSAQRSLTALLASGYVVALIPLLNLFPTHPPVADRYAQIPLVFLAPLILVPVLSRLPRKAATAGCAVVIALLAFLSDRQVPVWKDDESLFAHAVAVDHNAMQSIENLAYTQWLRNKEEAALETFALYAEKNPNDGRYELFQAWHQVHRGELDQAERRIGRASRKSVAPYLIHIVRAEIATARGNRRRTIREYERARDDAQRRFQRDSRARIYLRAVNQQLRALGPR